MTTLSQTAPTGARNRRHAGIWPGLWRHTAHGLGKLRAKVLTLLNASATHLETPPETWRFPLF